MDCDIVKRVRPRLVVFACSPITLGMMAVHSTTAMWGLTERKEQKAAPPKTFNIASRVQQGNVEQPLTCRIHPVAVLKVLDAYIRRQEGATRVIGTLLGWVSEGSIVDITDSFPVVHRDAEEGDEGAQVLMDQEYHKSMFELRQKVSPREVVVGWFSTGDKINATSAMIHNFYMTKESQFKATSVLRGPIHLLVGTSPKTQNSYGLKAFINIPSSKVAEHFLQFHEVPVHVQTTRDEKAGITQLMQLRRATREAKNSNTTPKDMATLDGFEGGLKELLGLFRRIQEYARAVKDGKMDGDLAVGRGLTTALCAEPVIDTEAVEQLCNSSLQDALMVVYLTNLTKSQISIAEKINALYNVSTDT